MFYIFEIVNSTTSVVDLSHTEREAMQMLFELKAKSDPEKGKIDIYYMKSKDFTDIEKNAINRFFGSVGSKTAVKIIIAQLILPRMQELGITVYRLSQLTGVSAQSLHRFIKSEQDLTLPKFLDVLTSLEINPFFVPKELDKKDYQNRIFFN